MAWILVPVPLQLFNLLNHSNSFMLGVVYPQDCEESDLLMKTFKVYKNCSQVSQPRPWNDVWKEGVKIPETADACCNK